MSSAKGVNLLNLPVLPTILWPQGHAGNVYLVNTKTEQVGIGKVETDADYLKGRQLAHESQDMSAQQEWLKYVRHHLGD
ncbi:MAG: hypothetical protein FRX48_03647 [Lasallia pustulata]|uniref:Uncharacterized protein n=1 Tax=Lasallia pustulata TaxID=136370 RepID=A0A5M8PUJ2_9LECA|nr:MAG: hypothetical protein FRX48_03647 [Lasallia pustulata]